jgi:hypothetical protein
MSESRKQVLKETAVIGIGLLVCTGLMFAVYALLGYFDLNVLLGGLVGSLLAASNFFFMAIVATIAADMAQRQDVPGGQKLMRASYPVRILVLGVLLFVCAKSGLFNILALALPLLFVRPIIMVTEFFRKKGA